MSDIEEKIRKILSAEIGRDCTNLSPVTTFKDMGLDSLDAVAVLLAVEEEFKFQFSDNQAKDLESLQALVNFIHQKVGRGGDSMGDSGESQG